MALSKLPAAGIASGAVTASQISDSTITAGKLATGVSRDNIRNSISTTVALSGNYPANTWNHVCYVDQLFGWRQGITLVEVIANTYYTGSTYSGYWLFMLSFFGGSTNGSVSCDMTRLHVTGHAINNGQGVVSLRTQERSAYAATDAGRTHIQIYPTENWVGLNSTGGREVYLRAYQLT